MTTTATKQYHIYRAPGWHGEPSDPLIERTNDERYAAMRAGCRIDIGMPGQCNRHDAYAEDKDGNRVEPIESFFCDACEELVEWGETGPVGVMDGRILECPGGVEKHLVTWICESCADTFEESEDEE